MKYRLAGFSILIAALLFGILLIFQGKHLLALTWDRIDAEDIFIDPVNWSWVVLLSLLILLFTATRIYIFSNKQR
ncbi:MAG: hypothetical protein ACLFR1_04155 [Spirochaetia bacterium]